MGFTETMLAAARPASIRGDVRLPRREAYFASPVDWRDEVLYFLLVDRFSDGREGERTLLDRSRVAATRPAGWRWDAWAESGQDRFQGGTLKGVRAQLPYLERLGVTTLWLSPVFKQRGHQDSYHGYGIQDFLEVDPRFGTRADLVELVAAAHARGLRIILDIIFNHSGENWVYPADAEGGEHTPRYIGGRYGFGAWLGPDGQRIAAIAGPDDGVWPQELQDPEDYTRAGSGSLGEGDAGDPNAQHKRTDFITLRDFALSAPGVLSDLAACYKYWIALTDCDGFRIDTLKHVSLEEARNFCGTVREFCANLGKANFLLAGEIAGGDFDADRYLDVLERNLSAALDIGGMRPALTAVAKGLTAPDAYFAGFDPGRAVMGSHRNLGNRHVAILDDHDHVFGQKLRFSAEAASDHQVAAGVALMLFTLGIPCIYYGTEQALGGPEPAERRWLPGWGSSDSYLREAMFGPRHPRAKGRAGLAAGEDAGLPGFGPSGSVGQHVFDQDSPAYRRIAALCALRRALPVLRHGRQYLRPLAIFGPPFALPGPGELIAWSRILDDEEALCVVNGHGTQARGGDVLVDAGLNLAGGVMTVVLNSAQAGGLNAGRHPVGTSLPVQRAADGTAFVAIRDLPPSEVLVLVNHP